MQHASAEKAAQASASRSAVTESNQYITACELRFECVSNSSRRRYVSAGFNTSPAQQAEVGMRTLFDLCTEGAYLPQLPVKGSEFAFCPDEGPVTPEAVEHLGRFFFEAFRRDCVGAAANTSAPFKAASAAATPVPGTGRYDVRVTVFARAGVLSATPFWETLLTGRVVLKRWGSAHFHRRFDTVRESARRRLADHCAQFQRCGGAARLREHLRALRFGKDLLDFQLAAVWFMLWQEGLHLPGVTDAVALPEADYGMTACRRGFVIPSALEADQWFSPYTGEVCAGAVDAVVPPAEHAGGFLALPVGTGKAVVFLAFLAIADSLAGPGEPRRLTVLRTPPHLMAQWRDEAEQCLADVGVRFDVGAPGPGCALLIAPAVEDEIYRRDCESEDDGSPAKLPVAHRFVYDNVRVRSEAHAARAVWSLSALYADALPRLVFDSVGRCSRAWPRSAKHPAQPRERSIRKEELTMYIHFRFFLASAFGGIAFELPAELTAGSLPRVDNRVLRLSMTLSHPFVRAVHRVGTLQNLDRFAWRDLPDHGHRPTVTVSVVDRTMDAATILACEGVESVDTMDVRIEPKYAAARTVRSSDLCETHTVCWICYNTADELAAEAADAEADDPAAQNGLAGTPCGHAICFSCATKLRWEQRRFSDTFACFCEKDVALFQLRRVDTSAGAVTEPVPQEQPKRVVVCRCKVRADLTHALDLCAQRVVDHLSSEPGDVAVFSSRSHLEDLSEALEAAGVAHTLFPQCESESDDRAFGELVLKHQKVRAVRVLLIPRCWDVCGLGMPTVTLTVSYFLPADDEMVRVGVTRRMGGPYGAVKHVAYEMGGMQRGLLNGAVAAGAGAAEPRDCWNISARRCSARYARSTADESLIMMRAAAVRRAIAGTLGPSL